MLHISHADQDMLKHTAHVMTDRMLESGDYITKEDGDTVEKINRMGDAGTALVVTGDEIDAQRAEELMSRVLEAEMANWVPGSSPRLIWRAGAALGILIPGFLLRQGNPDCGPERIQHPLYSLWIARRYLMACSTCGRLFP